MKKMTNIKKFLERNNIEYASKLVYPNLEEITFYINDLKLEVSNPMEKTSLKLHYLKKTIALLVVILSIRLHTQKIHKKKLIKFLKILLMS